MKYILLLFLCVDGCVWSRLGMGPGLVSMSPLRSSSRRVENFLLCGRSFPFMCFMVLIFLGARVVMWPRWFLFV